MGDVSVELGIDAKELYQELQNVTARFVQFSQTVEKAGNVPNFGQPIVEGHENVLRSSHRVASQIESFSRTLVASSNPIQIFASGLSALERSFNIPLGALAAIGIGAELFTEIAKGVAEYKKLNAEVDKLSEPRPNAQFQTLKDIETQANATQKVLEKLRGQQGEEGVGHGGLIHDLIATVSLGNEKGATEGIAGLIHEVREKRRGQIAGLEEQEAISQTGQIEKEQKKTEIATAHLNQGEFTSERIKINAEFDEKIGHAAETTGSRGVVELDKQRTIALAEVDKKEQEEKAKEEEKKRKEREKEEKEKEREQSKLETLRESVAKKEHTQHLDELPYEERHAELKADADKLLAGSNDQKKDEEDRLDLKSKYLDLVKQIGEEEEKHSKELKRDAEAQTREREKAAREAKKDFRHDDAERNRGNAQLTLQDLAEHGDLIGGPGGQARAALQEEAAARQSALHGDVEGATGHQSRAQEIKDSIGVLKDSEKSSEFKKALEDAAVLIAIEKNTKDMGKNR